MISKSTSRRGRKVMPIQVPDRLLSRWRRPIRLCLGNPTAFAPSLPRVLSLWRPRQFSLLVKTVLRPDGPGCADGVRDHANKPGATGRVENVGVDLVPVSYTHLRAHETVLDLVCRLLLEKKKTYKHTSTAQQHTTNTPNQKPHIKNT